ncbi:cell division cycle-associated protein 7-like [Eucyclogobius newberryi]|uniref:cell division cycle-associated protein 7-like n=1 Tax=Eucyclogobius newberryi TaxID=166745 RepID=UPI003B5B79D3
MCAYFTQAVFLGTHSLTKELADIFAEDSDNDETFYGFSEVELGDSDSETLYSENEDKLSENKRVKRAQPFKLRVALRSVCFNPLSSDEDVGQVPTHNVAKKTRIQKEKHVQFEGVENTIAPLPPLSSEADHAEDESFLAKREQNIKANKAMLAQLMADLQKMPGGAGFLKKQTGKAKKKSPHPPRSGGNLRKNPERTSRRLTRSMGGSEDCKSAKEEELELTLEEELLEVRGAPQRRGTPRPNQTKPHMIRPVEDITEEELELVADSMTEKIYNKVTGSTCHQCRQKTIDTKTCCRNEGCRGIHGQFCGPCLRNRYGEDVKKALINPEWHCPPCRGICNCSFCRQREGRCPTGILFPLAQYHGFSDVHSYLTSLRNKVKNEEDV